MVLKVTTNSIHICSFSEARLNRLEGKDRRLTSKDIMSALSEARDDHLADARTTTTAYVNEFAEMDILEPEEKTAGCCGVWRHGHLRRRGWGGQELSDADRREYACLVDCDELEWSVRNETVSTDGGCHNDDDTVRPVQAT